MCIEDLACSFWRRNWFEIELWETHDMINPTSGWGQCSSVCEPLCLEVCLIQSLALKSMICAASSSMSSRRNEGMIWWSRLIIGLSWLSDDFYFYFYFSWGIVESLKISRVQDPLDQLSVMSVHIMCTGFQIVSLKNSGKPEQSARDSDDECIWYCFQIVSLKSCGGLWAAPNCEEHYFHVILCFQIAS